LRVRGLQATYSTGDGTVRAVNGVDFDVQPGEVLAIVGESGSGKTATALAISRLLPVNGRVTAGSVEFEGQNLFDLAEEPMRRLRGPAIGMVFQDPLAGLNPVVTVGDQVAEIITSHRDVSRKEAQREAVAIMARVGLPDPEQLAKRHPFQLSGGMAQRVMIAIAMALGPRLLIADEPTSALDMTIQAQILRQIDDLRKAAGTAVILITHDLGVVAQIADRVAVMYAGYLVEQAESISLFRRPSHAYTAALLAALPRLDDIGRALRPIPGAPPSLIDLPDACPYLVRCTRALNTCRQEAMPPVTLVAPEHPVRCYNPVWHPDATDDDA
jgi:oligopeptide/dipeptide ABC transporter ATP-binding protein